jgi:hypothetical protein
MWNRKSEEAWKKPPFKRLKLQLGEEIILKFTKQKYISPFQDPKRQEQEQDWTLQELQNSHHMKDIKSEEKEKLYMAPIRAVVDENACWWWDRV